jgi:hypothetical protein
MKGAIEKLRAATDSARQSVKGGAEKSLAFVKQHSPTSDQLRAAKERTTDAAKSVGEGIKDLAAEVMESKPFRDGAKGALVGATIAVPLPLVGPLFGGVLGAAVAVYFGQRAGAGGSQEVEVPAEGSPVYTRLREFDDLRRRGILTRKQFEEQVHAVLQEQANAVNGEPPQRRVTRKARAANIATDSAPARQSSATARQKVGGGTTPKKTR